jgi:glycosyl transferase family 25
MTKTVVINIPHRTDRRREVEDQLTSVGWTAEIFPAVKPDEPGPFPSTGARGCFMSHLAVLRSAAGHDRLILIEDDLNFTTDFSSAWRDVERFLDSVTCNIFYPASFDGQSGVFEVPPEKKILRSHFIVFDRVGIAQFADGLEAILARPAGHALGGPMHVDGAYNTIRRQNSSIKTYACSPALGYQRSSRTDVADTHWADRYIPAAASVARKIRNQLRGTS